MNKEQQTLENAKGDDVIAESESSPSRLSPVRHNFPDKLHYVLNEMAKDGLEHIMSWQPHGRCFVVHDQKRLEQHILPHWFRQAKYSSFQRQLNIYGFSRIPRGVDKGGYYHKYFLRGKPELAQKIPRQKFKGTGARKASSGDDVPNFYEMSPLPAAVEARSDVASPPPIETTETRDPVPWSTPPAQQHSCYDLPPPNRMPQTLYAPTMTRAIPIPEMIVVSDGTRQYGLQPCRDHRAWANQSPPPSQGVGYYGYYNMHPHAGLCQLTFEK